MKINHSVFIIIVALLCCMFCDIAIQVKTNDTDFRNESDHTAQTQNQSTVFDGCCSNNELFDIGEKRCVPLDNSTIDSYVSKQNKLSLGNLYRHNKNLLH